MGSNELCTSCFYGLFDIFVQWLKLNSSKQLLFFVQNETVTLHIHCSNLQGVDTKGFGAEHVFCCVRA